MRTLWLSTLTVALLSTGCAATLPTVQTGKGKLAERIHRAKHLGAMECAPADLAKAQSAYRFAREELSDGDLARAAEHLEEGLIAIDRALVVGPVCPARGAPVTNLDRDPSLDSDGDAIPDADDQCPWKLEDLDGFADGDGCPEPDNDNDLVMDLDDQCPDDPEDADGFEDEDGCPDSDNDGDNFPDDEDSCPNAAETVNGVEDDDGCPDFTALHTRQDGNAITFMRPLAFGSGSAVLLQRSAPAVAELGQLMDIHLGWTIRIEGHTDNRGDEDTLKQLSTARAGAVAQSLISAGIEPDRIIVTGIGGANPMTTNRTPSGRATNNRIEVYVVEGL